MIYRTLRSPIQFRSFNQSIRISVADKRTARSAAKTLRMKFVFSSNHNWPCNNLWKIHNSYITMCALEVIFLQSPDYIVGTLRHNESSSHLCRRADRLFQNTSLTVRHRMLNTWNCLFSLKFLYYLLTRYLPKTVHMPFLAQSGYKFLIV